MTAVHASPYSGTWYPGDPDDLERLLNELFQRSAQRIGPLLPPGALGFVVPHAGLVYSGAVAAAAYRCLELARPERVIILGFAHRGAAPGPLVPDLDAFRTPLGEVPVDRETGDRLVASGRFRAVSEKAVCDHSVEIQLPLLQRALPGTPVIPIYTGPLDHGVRQEAAEVLAGLLRPGTILVASSDFTHFGREFGYLPFPADSRAAENLHRLDRALIEAAASMDSQFFLAELRSASSTLCGSAPISLLLDTLALMPDEVFARTLDYQTSGEITGDYHHSVSYAALGFFPFSAFRLDENDRRLLVESARATIEAWQQTGQRLPVYPVERTPGLEQQAGVFVTLYRDGELRGCVGTRSSEHPLYSMVPEMALAAALDDSRFTPLGRHETGLRVDISVLSPLKRIAGPERFRLGEHGLWLEQGASRSLLLPQVGVGRDWSAEDFLSALARKAGLPRGAWRSPVTRLTAFRAQVFGEDLLS